MAMTLEVSDVLAKFMARELAAEQACNAAMAKGDREEALRQEGATKAYRSLKDELLKAYTEAVARSGQHGRPS